MDLPDRMPQQTPKYILQGVFGNGNIQSEVLVLSANVSFNLGTLAIAVSVITGGKVSPHFMYGRRLPAWEVRDGDQICLKTGRGKNRTEPDGLVPKHVIHLGFSKPLYGSARRALHIFEVAQWKTIGPMNQEGLGFVTSL